MADKTLYTRIKNLVKSASDWTTSNPTLLQGEVGFESDTGKSKLGDGVTAWNSLGYIKVTTVDNLSSTSTTDPLSANQGKALSELISSRTPTTASVTIATGDWSSLSCTKTVTGVTSSTNVIVTPAPASIDTYIDASVRCTGQSTNSLTFTCASVPSASVTVNVMMMEPPPVVRTGNVGGKIFYIDSTADGTYTFKNAQGQTVAAPSVGTDCTGWTYESVGATKDKFYVYNEDAVFSAEGRTRTSTNPAICWTYLSTDNQSYIDDAVYKYPPVPSGKQGYEYYGYKGRVYEDLTEYTSELIGTGKSNTNNIRELHAYSYPQSSSISIRGGSSYLETIWHIRDAFCQGTYTLNGVIIPNNTGCDDWYVPSIDELDALKTSIGATNLASMFLTDLSHGVMIWSSSAVEYDPENEDSEEIWCSYFLDWHDSEDDFVSAYDDRIYDCSTLLIRSF